MSRTPHPRQVYARLAGSYDRSMSVVDRVLGFGAGRRWAVAGVSGRVLELGVGTGRTLPLHTGSPWVVGVDLSRPMLWHASRRAAAGLGAVRVSLVEADAAALPFPDAHFDAVISTLTLCTYPDPVAAMREALRVLRPGGQLRCLEHGQPSGPVLRSATRLLEPLALRCEADHLTRHPAHILRDAGADVVSVARSRGGLVWRVVAQRPS
jgi:ubiquinone/menaquinone biosynthesis C-methylase UbiE